MQTQIEIKRRPAAPGTLPPLPPYLQPRKRRGRYAIVPDIARGEVRTKTRENNCWTIHYVWMVRIELSSGTVEGPVHVNTRAYRNWLETYEPPHGIPPHICFGGAVESVGEADPTFHDRWVAYAKETFC